MKYFVLIPLFLVVLCFFFPSPSGADTLTRFYTHKSLGKTFSTNIVLRGNILHIAKFKYWLNEIVKIPVGEETLRTIVESGHTLTIEHNNHSRISAGRTLAPMTEDLINGIGADIEILFDASVTEAGSHLVYDTHGDLIEYTAIENLFHELSHAKHKMNGTWRYFDSEGQAIEDENIFRKEYNTIQNQAITQRAWKNGVPIETVVDLSTFPKHTYRVRSNPPLAFSP